MLVGEYSHGPNTAYMRRRSGGELLPRTKAHLIWAPRRFFNDIQEWEWIERRFDARRAFRLPRSIAARIGPEPRVIADDVWAKLMWAGLNLTSDDLPLHANRGGTGTPWYPLELVRATALVWLFSGLRTDEILRLRVGTIRWQQQTEPAGEPVCLLDVPTSKTATAFSKPVDPIVGDAIDRWEQARPAHPKFIDRRTGEPADMLFCFRGTQLSSRYINRVLVPLLCRKAGVPRDDVRGAITGHRARATIATQLYNAKDPMSLFELQAWLGHSSPHSTQHYARITPTTLTKAYTDAGYFARNVRRSRCCSNATRSPAAKPAAVSRSSTTTSGTATAHTASSSSARTGWRAPAVTSISPSNPARRSCWKPRTGCSGCWSRSRSPTLSEPLSRVTTSQLGG